MVQYRVSFNETNNFLVVDPPKLDVNSDLKVLTAGDSFILDCSPVEAKPPANATTFSFNSLNIDLNDPSVTITNFVLTISNIQRRHRGTYSCEVSNGFGNAATAAVPVNVLGELHMRQLTTYVQFALCFYHGSSEFQ